MMALILTYCLIADPRQCVEYHPALDPDATSMGCMVAAQQIAASEEQRLTVEHEHPGFELVGFRCAITIGDRRAA